MSNVALVTRAVEGIVRQDLRPLRELTAEAATLRVAGEGERRGREAVAGYFASLGGIVTFWDVRVRERGTRVEVLGRERFTTTGGITGETDFALLFDVHDGAITGLRVVEDLEPSPVAMAG